ncbi:hypothetical protein GDO78_018599 [Eleutherodactylus coqui]|uniref:Globin domain-containing protein n=1 Tax=Eleutherodactylus coqui TaxID=57060 RepID=A0A8J6B708_ELECQ|nr:hypothetical protein GDO78_018599 [Eleutherodactylus coqui]
MPLSTSERAHVQSIMSKIVPQANELGGEALEKMFLSFPQTKTSFPHLDLSPGSADLKNHGAKILKALGNAANHLDDLHGNQSSLSDLHAYKMDPGNFRLLSKSIKAVMARRFPNDFTAEVDAAWDKFMSEVGTAMNSKY